MARVTTFANSDEAYEGQRQRYTIREALEVDNIGRILNSELKSSLLLAKHGLARSLVRHPEEWGPRVHLYRWVCEEIAMREAGFGPLPPIKATYIGRRS